MKKLFTAIKNKISPYYRNMRLMRELAIWKQGLYHPGHFYSPIVSRASFPTSYAVNYNQPIPGIDLNDELQLKILKELHVNYSDALFPLKPNTETRYYFENQYFSFSDAIFLSLMMRKYRPKRIIEIGSGYSSAVMLDTNERFLSNKTELIFIEPYPEERLQKLLRKTDHCVLKKEFVQDVDRTLFATLSPADILFIDSSHVCKYGSDLNYLMFEILPLLKPGVVVHFHDIFFPFEYPLEWIRQGRSWNEAYMLRAFLQFNSAFEILIFSSYLEGKYNEWFRQNMPMCLKNHEIITVDSISRMMNTTGQSIYILKRR